MRIKLTQKALAVACKLAKGQSPRFGDPTPDDVLDELEVTEYFVPGGGPGVVAVLLGKVADGKPAHTRKQWDLDRFSSKAKAKEFALRLEAWD